MADVLIRVKSFPGQPGVCKGCHRAIVWMETINGKRMPMNDYAQPRHVGDGVDLYSADDAHWASCPAKSRFDRKPQHV